MNAVQLLRHFDRVGDAPDAIPRLRRFILDLAVRGKLVPQDVTEEPASELLKRIAAEKTRLVKAAEIRKPPVLESLSHAKVPYVLPATWEWVRVGEIFDYDAGIKRDPKELMQDRWLLELEDIEKDSSTVLERLRVRDRDSQSTKSQFEIGDILYGKLRPYLNKVVVAAEPGYSTTEIVAIRPFLKLCPEYCALAFRRPDFVAYVERLGRGTKMPRLRTPDAIAAAFPLPPLAEQRRIVAKVDELMTLCDRLEAARAEREATRDRLTVASLARLNAPDPDPATFANHARFALDALPTLTARPDQIKLLRQTVLNLAVRGELVEQHPADEPVIRLLERLSAARKRLEADRVIRPVKNSMAITKAPFDIPQSWIWCHLTQVCDVVDPNPSHRMPIYVPEGGLPFISSENFAGGDTINFTVGKRVAHSTVMEQTDRFPILEGAFGFSRIGTIGKTRPLPQSRNYAISHAVCVINPLSLDDLSMRYLRLAMGVDGILAHAHGGTRSIGVPDLGMAVIRTMAIPLPPLAEQHRIVNRVDELMTLYDQLEAKLSHAAATSGRLLEAVLHEALSPAIQRELEAAE